MNYTRAAPGVKPAADFLRLARRKVEAVVRARKSRAAAAAVAEDLLDYFSVPVTLREHYTRRDAEQAIADAEAIARPATSRPTRPCPWICSWI